MEEQIQEKRQLPRRTSRGVRVSQTQQEKQKDDAIYSNLFGNIDQDDDDESFSEIVGLRPLQTFSINFKNYNYGRGYHYFFDLNTFPRVQGSPSYASDENNRFNHTYRNDQQQINGTKINKIINRKYIGLPLLQNSHEGRKNRDKNVCHYHLFDIEDKKFQNTRLIRKCKYVLGNLQKLQKQNKLRHYTQFRKDTVLYEVCNKDNSIEKKKQILQNRIITLQERVKNMEPYWDWQDNIYYHFSQDQIFHNIAMAKGQKLSQKYLQYYICKRINDRKLAIQGDEQKEQGVGQSKLRIAIQTWLKYEEQDNNALSINMQNKLKSLPKIIEMFQRKQQLINFPLFTFNFGFPEIARYIDPLIKAKLQKQDESCYYVYKSFIKRLFKRDLACQQGLIPDSLSIEEYNHEMKKKLIQIQDFYKSDQINHKKIIYLDELVEIDKIQNSPIEEIVNLLESKDKIEINIKELMLLFFYRNISIALEQFEQYLKKDPEIIKFMASTNYDKYHYGIAKILHQPEYCILINDLTRFAEILSHKNLCPDLKQVFNFSFNSQLGIAYVWQQPENDDWQTDQEQDQDEQDIDEQKDSPISSVKRQGSQNDEKKISKKKVKID